MTMVKPVGDAKRTIDIRMIPTAIELLGDIATGSRKVCARDHLLPRIRLWLPGFLSGITHGT